MFRKDYYCLIAGLREYSLDAEKKGFDAPAIIAEIKEELSARDRRTVELFYTYYDIENIVSLRAVGSTSRRWAIFRARSCRRSSSPRRGFPSSSAG